MTSKDQNLNNQSPKRSPRAHLQFRIVCALIAIGCGWVLSAAYYITPAKAGHGSHTQLNLPRCGFLERTGYPCPTCGMTTAFSHMAHGHVLSSFKVQPAGALGAIACIGLFFMCSYIAISGWRSSDILFWFGMHGMKVILAIAGVVLLSWGWMCLMVYLNSDH